MLGCLLVAQPQIEIYISVSIPIHNGIILLQDKWSRANKIMALSEVSLSG